MIVLWSLFDIRIPGINQYDCIRSVPTCNTSGYLSWHFHLSQFLNICTPNAQILYIIFMPCVTEIISSSEHIFFLWILPKSPLLYASLWSNISLHNSSISALSIFTRLCSVLFAIATFQFPIWFQEWSGE